MSEVWAYGCVSFLYALGQSLYDMFQSQQAKRSSDALLETWGVYVSAYGYSIVVSANALAKAMSSPYVGHLSDRFGRREVLVATLMLNAACLRWCGSARSYWSVLACRLATGCVANGGLLTARATDVAADHAQRTRLFSLFTTAWAFARVAAALVLRVFGCRIKAACRLAAKCQVLAAVVAASAFENHARHSSHHKQASSKVRLGELARELLKDRLAFWLFVTSVVTPRVDAAAFVRVRFGRGPEAVGFLKALEAVAVVCVSLSPLPRRINDRLGDRGAAVAAAACVALGWLVIAAAPSMRALYGLVALRATFAALYDPAARSLVFNAQAGHKHGGSLVGLQQSLKGATQVFSSWLGAYLTSISVAAPLGLSAITMCLNALVIGFVDRTPKPQILGAPAAAVDQRASRASTDAASDEDDPIVSRATAAGGGDGVDSPVWIWELKEQPPALERDTWRPRPDEKRLRLLCACESNADAPRSVADVATWLRSRGQAAAAAVAAAAGVDGTALAIATVDELFEALDAKVPRLVCRSILLALQQTTTPVADDHLSLRGRRAALRLRDSVSAKEPPPGLVVVAPHRAAIQTALLAVGGRTVAHDAAASRPSSRRDLEFEYGAAVDFGSCDDDPASVQCDAPALARRTYALLSFLTARPEHDLALVADSIVLQALVAQGVPPTEANTNRPFHAGELRDLKLRFAADDDAFSEDDSSPESW